MKIHEGSTSEVRGSAARSDILAQLGAAVREQEAAEEGAGAGEAAALTPERTEALLDLVLAQAAPALPARPPRRRVLPFAALTLAAAAIVLLVPWRSPPSTAVTTADVERAVVAESVDYLVRVSGGSRGQAGGGQVETFRPGQRIHVEAVPERPVADALGLRVSGIHEGVVHPFAWPSRTISAEKGIFRIEGPVEDLTQFGAGAWLLRVELLRSAGRPATVLGEPSVTVEVR